MKTCSKCKEELPLEDFCPDKRRKDDGKGSWCKPCHNKYNRDNRIYRNTPQQNKEKKWWTMFRLRPEQYYELLESQGGGCAICGNTNPNGDGLAVDHDHSCCPGNKSCGKCVRGLLCHLCNHGLGNFKDDEFRLESAIFYLRKKDF